MVFDDEYLNKARLIASFIFMRFKPRTDTDEHSYFLAC
ncbi:hypothetical protein Vca1114GL_02766 [Vibrio campbellii]|nr:hypothetical protein Vca1114GL_02766 [Vibrio campbellii]